MRFILVTGMSGAGKTHALRVLEDLGYYCIDNLPPMLIHTFVELCTQSKSHISRAAVVVDTRGGEFFDSIYDALYSLKDFGIKYELLFMDAADETLVKRYKETRRSHPLQTGNMGLIDSIAYERGLLMRLKENASFVVDTTGLAARELREEIINHFAEEDNEPGISIQVSSFGFKYGIPIDADLVLDVRFLPNPFYIDRLKAHSGKDEDVRNYVFAFEETNIFVNKLLDMLLFLIPHYLKEGKNRLVVAIGCTGGMHRSVAIADAVASRITASGYRVLVDHRDLERESHR